MSRCDIWPTLILTLSDGWQLFTSYLELTSWESGWLDAYSDLISCSLWMACAIIDFCAEIYFLEAKEEDDKKEEPNDEEEICNRPEEGRR